MDTLYAEDGTSDEMNSMLLGRGHSSVTGTKMCGRDGSSESLKLLSSVAMVCDRRRWL